VPIGGLIQHREAPAGADITREVADLRLELGFRFGVPLEPPQRFGRVEVQLRQPGSGLLQFGDRNLEQRRRVRVLALVVEEARVDVGGHRQLRVGLVGERGLASRRVGVATGERDLCEEFMRRRAGPRVAFAGDLHRQLRVHPGVVPLALLHERRRRAQITVGFGWFQGDVVLVRVEDQVETLDPTGEGGQLAPDVGHAGILAHDLLQQRDRLGPLAFAGQVDGRAVGFEKLPLVFRVGQRLTGRRWHVGLRAHVAEGLKVFPRVGRDVRRRQNRGAGRDAVQRGAQRLPSLPAFGRDVFVFSGIPPQVVELVARRPDVAVPFVGERGQLAPAEVVPRVQRF